METLMKLVTINMINEVVKNLKTNPHNTKIDLIVQVRQHGFSLELISSLGHIDAFNP